MISADRVRLPFHPGLAEQVVACLKSEGPASKRFRELVGRDPALLCGLFRAANSTFYAGLQKTVSIEEAVTRLGSDKAARLVEQVCLEGDRCRQGRLLPHYLPNLWRHARGCALGARWLALRCGYQALSEQAYLAGLLHDIGKHLLLAALEEIACCGEPGIELADTLVAEVFASMHVEQGVRLLEDWNLARPYLDVVADHHADELNPRNIMVALVRLANKGCRKLGLGLDRSPGLVLPATAEAQLLGIDEIALAEFEIMLEDRFCAGHALDPAF
jgi:putative nucleotidyltransferase with HDIG domain